MTLAKTSALNGVAVGVRMLSALALNKVLAVLVGPSGYALIGQFQNVVTMITTFSAGAINNGVVKYTAEASNDQVTQEKLWRTAGSMALFGSLLMAGPVILFRSELARWFLHDVAYAGVFVWFGATLVLFALNALLLAILNGKREISRFVTSNIAGSLFAVGVIALFTWRWGLYGALVALCVNQSLVCVVTLHLCRSAPWFRLRGLFGVIDAKQARQLAQFVLMAATSAIVVPLSLMLVRQSLVAQFGWSRAGCWDAIWRISSLYLMAVTTTLSVYYLPRIAEIEQRSELLAEIRRVASLAIPFVLASAACIYVFRRPIVRLLFSGNFLSMEELFLWQLAGDVVKTVSWLYGYVLVGKAMTRIYIVTEVLFALSFWLLTLAATSQFGFMGVTVAYFVNYSLHLLAMYCLVVKSDARTLGLRARCP